MMKQVKRILQESSYKLKMEHNNVLIPLMRSLKENKFDFAGKGSTQQTGLNKPSSDSYSQRKRKL
jgi:hypothetical protein